MPSERFQRQSLGVLFNKIKEARILLVGAGGIGCELLKNLVKIGYGEVHIIDLDTIDLSNLNRQFLFRHEHIKKAKSLVAKEVAQKFNPQVKLIAYHANIKEVQFNTEWFSSFSIVFNALDNLEARRHVNRMCLIADVPLIESGTTGFNGQVQVIKKGRTACYDCNPKQTPKTFPVCTIRSTPSQPIHCIVWAKSYLLPELFGVSEDELPELDTSANSENAEEIQKLKEEAEALKKIRESMGSDNFARQIFNKVFKDDIERLANMEDMWKTRKPPKALDYDILESGSNAITEAVSHTDQRVWTLPETFVVFKDSLARLSKRLLQDQAEASKTQGDKPIITFDKDDDDTLDLVTAAANLRSAVFAIEPKSKFDTKQMAGNIIPAIATTNAMVAGLCVMEAFKVMRGEYGRTKMVFLDRGNVSAGVSDPPNPGCAVCGMAMLRMQIDPERATLNDLVHGILKLKLGYGNEISVLNEQGGLIFDYMDEDDEDEPTGNLEKKLAELDVRDGSFVLIKDDEGETPRVDLQLAVEMKKVESGEEDPVQLLTMSEETLEIPRKPKKASVEANGTENGDTEVVSITTNGTLTAGAITKRKRELEDIDSSTNDTPIKKAQQKLNAISNGEGPITVDEGDGIIEIGD